MFPIYIPIRQTTTIISKEQGEAYSNNKSFEKVERLECKVDELLGMDMEDELCKEEWCYLDG